MAKDITKISEFTFDEDQDWSFGGTTKDTTNVEAVVNGVKGKAGATIDDADDDDDEGEKTNLDDEKNQDKEEDKDDNNNDEPVKPKKQEVKKVEPKKEEKKEDKKDTKKKQEDDEDDIDNEGENDDDEDEEFFGNKKEDTKSKKEKSSPKKEVEDQDDEDFYTTLALEEKEKGILEHVEIPKDKKLTEEEYLELRDEEIEARVGEVIEAAKDKLGDDGIALLKAVQKGATVKDFVDAYYGSGIDYDKFDATDEAQRDTLIRFYVTNHENLDSPEDIEDRIQSIKDSGKAEAKAEQWAAKLKKIEDNAKKEFNDAVEAQAKEKAEKKKKFNEAIINTANKVDEVNGFPINKKVGALLTKPTVKVGKNTYVPAFHTKLSEILNPKNEEARKKLLLLGTLIDNDFNFSALVPKAETKVISRAKNLLQRSKTGSVKASTAGTYASKVLADVFADDEE